MISFRTERFDTRYIRGLIEQGLIRTRWVNYIVDVLASMWYSWHLMDMLYLPPLPPLQRSWKGGILVSPCPSVRLSVCGQNHVRSVSSTILVGSISYLHILSRCFACKICLKIWNLGKFFKFVTLTFFFFTWDPIWLNSMGNHEAGGVGGILRRQAFSLYHIITAKSLAPNLQMNCFDLIQGWF